jgi:hypothetical protein
MRSAVIGAAAVMTGTSWTPQARAQQAAKQAGAPKLGATLSPDLNVVKAVKGPIITVLEEFYKVGPGPSSSHTIGPMRITYDFYQRCLKLPPDQRCAFGAVKAWIAVMIATNEIASRHRVDLDTTIKTLAETGRDMSAKYKETSEGGLAANLVLC